MTDSCGKSKKKKFTINATEAGIGIAERALIRLGFETKTNFAKSHYIGRSTVTKFFSRKPIQLDTFKKICQELKLNWREIAGIEEAQSQQPKIDSRKNLAKDGEARQMGESGSRQVTIIEPSTGTIKAEITLTGNINSVSNLKILETILREHSGNTIQIQDIQEGSIKLTIEGSPEDIKKLVARIKSGELSQIYTFPVEDIQILTENSEDNSSDFGNSKWRLVQEIVTNSIIGRKLRGADFSDTDLRGADLINANLRGADLVNADLINANLRGANLINADLINANLRGADLIDADLINANLRGANLIDADLINANLRGANLIDADLINANLINANLINANLIDTDLINASVEQARFSNNQGISESMKRDLISRGAIFIDSLGSGDRSLVPTR